MEAVEPTGRFKVKVDKSENIHVLLARLEVEKEKESQDREENANENKIGTKTLAECAEPNVIETAENTANSSAKVEKDVTTDKNNSEKGDIDEKDNATAFVAVSQEVNERSNTDKQDNYDTTSMRLQRASSDVDLRERPKTMNAESPKSSKVKVQGHRPKLDKSIRTKSRACLVM